MSFVIKSGARQYIVDYGQQIIVNKIEGKENDTIKLDVLFAIGDDSKSPKTISAKIVKHQKGEKLRVVKYKNKSNYHRQYGPRQHETVLEILSK